jgi:hypothetical protein
LASITFAAIMESRNRRGKFRMLGTMRYNSTLLMPADRHQENSSRRGFIKPTEKCLILAQFVFEQKDFFRCSQFVLIGDFGIFHNGFLVILNRSYKLLNTDL